MISMADYGMIKLPAEEIIKQNNPATLPQTSAQTPTIKTASATGADRSITPAAKCNYGKTYRFF